MRAEIYGTHSRTVKEVTRARCSLQLSCKSIAPSEGTARITAGSNIIGHKEMREDGKVAVSTADGHFECEMKYNGTETRNCCSRVDPATNIWISTLYERAFSTLITNYRDYRDYIQNGRHSALFHILFFEA